MRASTGTRRSIWCRVKQSIRGGSGEFEVWEKRREGEGGGTLQDLEVLEVGVFGVDVKFYSSHGQVLWA